ncbi:FMN reductase [Streptomyces sp. NPDC127068]|uniref:FMN reductase n=1 Tax=Streptomyces sp. NPDC127068 TaxID=3347127 RepID=UPI00365A5F21
MKLVVVSAGLSVPSSTRLLADRLTESTVRRAPGTDVEVIELRDLAVEIAHNFVTGFPGPALESALESVAEADALIVVSPVFSASYSGLFKSFFDVIDKDALTGKPVLIGATGGTGRHSLVLDHALRPLFGYLRAVVLPTGVYAASEDWGAEGLAERIERAAGELVALTAPRDRAASAEVPAQDRGDGPAGTAGGAPRTVGSIEDRPLGTGSLKDRVVPFEEQLAALKVR